MISMLQCSSVEGGGDECGTSHGIVENLRLISFRFLMDEQELVCQHHVHGSRCRRDQPNAIQIHRPPNNRQDLLHCRHYIIRHSMRMHHNTLCSSSPGNLQISPPPGRSSLFWLFLGLHRSHPELRPSIRSPLDGIMAGNSPSDLFLALCRLCNHSSRLSIR